MMSKINIIDKKYINNSEHIIVDTIGLTGSLSDCTIRLDCKIDVFSDCSISLVNVFDKNNNPKFNCCETSIAIEFLIKFNLSESVINNEINFFISDFRIRTFLQKFGVGKILFEVVLGVLVPYYQSLYPSIKDIGVVRLTGFLSTADYGKEGWFKSFPFYFKLHKRLDIETLGYCKINTIFHNPNNPIDDYNDLVDTISECEESQYILKLMEKFSKTTEHKEIIFIFSR